jgi:arginine utilization protein RocB
VAAGQISPPPICLEAKDLRGGYEVTTPERVWIAFNWLSHSWTAPDLLKLFEQAVRTAASSAIDLFNQRAGAYAAMLGKTQGAPVAAALLISIEELRQKIEEIGGAAATARVSAVERAVQGSDDPLAQTRLIVSAMIAEAGVVGPTIVYGFSSLVYPSTHVARTDNDHNFVAALESARMAHEASGGGSISYREYFTGISDMSFFGHRPSAADAAYIAANTPSGDLVDLPRPDALTFPVVNIGPWGREFHQKLERVQAPYAFVELPMFIREIVRRFLG